MTNSRIDKTIDTVRAHFDVVRIVLVGTTHPGNIGSSARAMKAMGFSHLSLVAPKKFPAAAATAMASGADDLLADAQIVDTLAEALQGCSLVFGTTARDRHLEWPVMSPREAAVEMRVAVEAGPVAFVFGREQAGLTNAELDLCQRAIRIPTEAHFNSLNLAQAVQICAYEARNALLEAAPRVADVGEAHTSDPIASASALERLHRHFVDTMEAVSYLDPSNPRLLQRRLRRLLIGANMRQSESQILRGFLTAIERTLKRLGQPSDKTE